MKKSDSIKKLNFLINSCGIKENNLILSSFLTKTLAELNQEDIESLIEFLQHENDIDIYNWLAGVEVLPPRLNSNIFQKLIHHSISIYDN